MLRSIWILGLGIMMSLMACGVEPTQESASEEAALVDVSEANTVSDGRDIAELWQAASLEAGALRLNDVVTPMEACSYPQPGRWCCPFVEGCSCLGYQTCRSNGQWGVCQGAGRRGQPCP